MRIRTYLAIMAAAIFLPILLAGTTALEKIRQEERDTSIRSLKETAAISFLAHRAQRCRDGDCNVVVAADRSRSGSIIKCSGEILGHFIFRRSSSNA